MPNDHSQYEYNSDGAYQKDLIRIAAQFVRGKYRAYLIKRFTIRLAEDLLSYCSHVWQQTAGSSTFDDVLDDDGDDVFDDDYDDDDDDDDDDV